MRIELLRRFIVIAEELNLTSAAAKLFVAQPLLSKQLKQLEEEYGTKLINRTTTNMTLTPEGELLYERAKMICELDSQTRNEFAANMKRGNRLLKFALPPFIASVYFNGRFEKFLEKYPFLRLQIVEGGAFNTSQYLKSGVADIVVAHLTAGSLSELNSFYRHKVGFVLAYCKDAFPQFADKKVISVQDIEDTPVYICSRFASILHASESLRNVHFNIVCTTNVLSTGVKIVETGYAVGLFPTYTYHMLKDSKDLGLCVIDDEHLKIELHVLMAPNRVPDVMMSDFIDSISDSLDELFELEAEV